MRDIDQETLRALSVTERARLVLLLQEAGLYPRQGVVSKFRRVGVMVRALNAYSITMADILHLLLGSSAASGKSRRLLRRILPLLLERMPRVVDTSMPRDLQRSVVGVYQHLLSDPDSAIYHPGQSVADLHLILGVPMWDILDNVARGALVLTPTQSYASPLDLAMEDCIDTQP